VRQTNLSKEALDLLKYWKGFIAKKEVPSWDEYWLSKTFEFQKRSKDAQTECGAVIVSKDNELLSVGYNSFARDVDDGVLPNLRPEKYTWMIHAEHNAILNCARCGTPTKGATIYVTGHPCIFCLQYIYQVGIDRIVYGGNKTNMQESEDMKIRTEIFKHLIKDKVEFVCLS
jgi:dCMP deaminase